MYYRRKILLAILEVFGGELERIRLQKLLFLLTCQQEKATYEFVPYKFGCYSFSANADLCTMIKYGQVIQTDKSWEKLDNQSYLPLLSEHDRCALAGLKAEFGHFSNDELIRHTYQKYPSYAINSTIKAQILSAEDLTLVEEQRIKDDSAILFTVGYEGISLEAYLNKLLKSNIRALCDVRRNPLSMKYGFSKRQLETACVGVGIAYIHLPEFGIASEQRQELHSQNDYDQLFAIYAKRVAKQQDDLERLCSLMTEHGRIALTCFEAEVHRCHRGKLADALLLMQNWNYPIEHL